MREIKFRAWDKRANKMLKPISINDAVWMACVIGGDSDATPYTDTEWMQFTGLKDKNGKEIYEGDILNTWRGAPCPDTLKIVRWISNGRSHNGWNVSKTDKFEVIGNIYETPNYWR